jgi:uncharacterized protein (TIGR02246 family)
MAATAEQKQSTNDETELRALIARWSKAVREEDLTAIQADHDPDILMFDVPPPFSSRGLDAYLATWHKFFASSVKPVVFDFEDVEVAAGQNVAFATAVGRCVYFERNGEKTNLAFRLTIGFRKVDKRWRIVHEHHSVPATD